MLQKYLRKSCSALAPKMLVKLSLVSVVMRMGFKYCMGLQQWTVLPHGRVGIYQTRLERSSEDKYSSLLGLFVNVCYLGPRLAYNTNKLLDSLFKQFFEHKYRYYVNGFTLKKVLQPRHRNQMYISRDQVTAINFKIPLLSLIGFATE